MNIGHNSTAMGGGNDKERKRRLEIYERVDEAFTAKGIESQVARGKAIGVDQSTISNWKRGEFAPTNNNLLDIAELTGYEFNWLWSGRGMKITPPDDAASDEVNRILQAVDPPTREVIRRVVSDLVELQKLRGSPPSTPPDQPPDQ